LSLACQRILTVNCLELLKSMDKQENLQRHGNYKEQGNLPEEEVEVEDSFLEPRALALSVPAPFPSSYQGSDLAYGFIGEVKFVKSKLKYIKTMNILITIDSLMQLSFLCKYQLILMFFSLKIQHISCLLKSVRFLIIILHDNVII